MFFYVLASVNLGWKASNLTYRGMVEKGMYSFVRHPAYICKTLAWFIGSIPFFIKYIENDKSKLINYVFFVAWIFVVYGTRAITEERHLIKVSNGEYEKYMRKVRYRFIPGIF